MKHAFTLGEIAEKIGATLQGDANCVIARLATLANAKAGDLSFCVANRHDELQHTLATAVIVPDGVAASHVPNLLKVKDPYLAYAQVSQWFATCPKQTGVHPTAVIDATAQIHATASVGANAVIEAGVKLHANVVIGPLCYVGENTEIGEGSRLYARVSVYHGVHIGKRAVIHSGAVIGSDGFGFAEERGQFVKIAQLGSVQIADDVEIGANTTIDRGALDNTVICNGVKLDNQIQIAHNVVLGEHTAMAGMSGVAGSTHIGKYCRIGGAAMIGGHLTITDKVFLSGSSMVTRSIHQSGIYSSGIPARPNAIWKRNVARFQRLDAVFSQLKKMGLSTQVDSDKE